MKSILFIIFFTLITASSSFNSRILGDINDDGEIDVLDILQQVNFILNITEPTSSQMCASNINLDQNLDLLDVVLLVAIILNQ